MKPSTAHRGAVKLSTVSGELMSAHADIGSMILSSTSGALYVKTGNADDAWQRVASAFGMGLIQYKALKLAYRSLGPHFEIARDAYLSDRPERLACLAAAR